MTVELTGLRLRGASPVKTPSLRQVARATFAIAARPVLLRSLATFAAVGLPGAIVFAPQGLEARDLVRAMHAAPLLRSTVWLGWLALSTHASAAAFAAPGMSALRAARGRRSHVVACLLALAATGQVPWAILWLRGAGLLAALASVGFAITLATSAFALVRRRSLVGVVVPALATISVAFDAPAPLQALLACVLAPISVDQAWRAALEHRSAARARTRAQASPVVALVTVHWLRLARFERLRLTLAAMVGSLGAAGLLTLRSDPSARPVGRALAIMTVPLVLGSALLVAPLIDGERKLDPRLRALRVRRGVVVAAFLLAIAAPTSALAATSGILAGVAARTSIASLGGALASWALVLGAVVGAWGRRHDRTERRSPVLFAVGVALIAILTVTIAMELP